MSNILSYFIKDNPDIPDIPDIPDNPNNPKNDKHLYTYILKQSYLDPGYNNLYITYQNKLIYLYCYKNSYSVNYLTNICKYFETNLIFINKLILKNYKNNVKIFYTDYLNSEYCKYELANFKKKYFVIYKKLHTLIYHVEFFYYKDHKYIQKKYYIKAVDLNIYNKFVNVCINKFSSKFTLILYN